jgi:SAM-dependent methyltransferase
MNYYDNEKNVEQYMRVAAGYDGKLLVDALRKHLPDRAKLLELGIGPGKDLLLLNEHYEVTGSDASAIFVERFKKLHPRINVKLLDAITLDTNERFQGIYSNKVLCHLERDQLRNSFQQQARALESGGIALHSFWHGDEERDYQGLRFVYYREAALRTLVEPAYELLDAKRYTEIETDDSLYIVLRKRQVAHE